MESILAGLTNLFNNAVPQVGTFFSALLPSDLFMSDIIVSLLMISLTVVLLFLIFRLFMLAFKIGILASILYLMLTIFSSENPHSNISSSTQIHTQPTINVVSQNHNQFVSNVNSNLPPARMPSVAKSIADTNINKSIFNLIGKSSDTLYKGMDFVTDSYYEAKDILDEYEILPKSS